MAGLRRVEWSRRQVAINRTILEVADGLDLVPHAIVSARIDVPVSVRESRAPAIKRKNDLSLPW